MEFSNLDWIIVISFLVLSLIIGIVLRKRASQSLEGFFLGGRNMPWLLAGVSMVATTFAADTPLAVTELVAKNGISGNWLWWNFLAGGMLTTFFFARLWRRANVLTEVELVELRYSGRAAAWLRGFKSVYLGLFMNVLIMGWVNLALATLLEVFFGLQGQTLFIALGIAMVTATIYSSLAGLWGVAVTDFIQFFIAMTGSIVLAVVVLQSEQVGGLTGLKAQLPDWSMRFFPEIGTSSSGKQLAISAGAFLAYAGMQWWASWYPGAEPGGGGYIAQRMMSTRTERGAVYSTLFFQIAHYCIRPWPWILVALACLLLYPDLAASEYRMGYVFAMRDFLPVGLKGLLVTAFIAAYLSTISTQLNWGAGYLVNDLYLRFMDKGASQKKLVAASRITTGILMVIAIAFTGFIESISGVWEFLIECGAGLGLVLILRWYWWRINAWSEIAASLAPFIFYSVSRFILGWEFPNSYFLTIGGTTVVWVAVTYLTAPTDREHLIKFYQRVKPDGWWPSSFKTKDETAGRRIAWLFVAWISAIAFVYSVLFATGKFLFLEYATGSIYVAISLVSVILLRESIRRTRILA